MTLLLLLFATGMLAGLVDAIAGGGGLISVPVLFSIGMPPHLLLGTNKLQSSIGVLVATYRYYRHGLIAKETLSIGLIFGVIGALLGAITGQTLTNEVLGKIIPLLLLVVLLYTLFSPRLSHQDKPPLLKESWFYLVFGFAISFYDGFFGPGSGLFWVFSLTFFLGYNLLKATAYTKLLNLNSNLTATLCFAIGGHIDYRIAFCMAAGALIGGRLGAGLAINRGTALIRPVFLAMTSITIMILFYKAYAQSALFSYLTQQYGLVPQIIVGCIFLTSVAYLYLKKSRREINSD